MKKSIILIAAAILFFGCSTTTSMLSLSDTQDASKSETAWSRANAYLVINAKNHTITQYTITANFPMFPLFITREMEPNAVKFRFVSYYDIYSDVMGPDPFYINKVKRQEAKIKDLMNYMKTGLSENMTDAPVQLPK